MTRESNVQFQRPIFLILFIPVWHSNAVRSCESDIGFTLKIQMSQLLICVIIVVVRTFLASHRSVVILKRVEQITPLNFPLKVEKQVRPRQHISYSK